MYKEKTDLVIYLLLNSDKTIQQISEFSLLPVDDVSKLSALHRGPMKTWIIENKKLGISPKQVVHLVDHLGFTYSQLGESLQISELQANKLCNDCRIVIHKEAAWIGEHQQLHFV